jgi:hypothetical protein
MAEGRKAGETTGPKITKNYTVRDALAGQSVALVDFCTISNSKIPIILRTAELRSDGVMRNTSLSNVSSMGKKKPLPEYGIMG